MTNNIICYSDEMKFKKHTSANCKVIVYALYNRETGEWKLDNITLISYVTPVLKYKFDTEELECRGLYSMTTRRHIGWFTDILQGINYYDVKNNAGKSIKNVRLKVGWDTAFKKYWCTIPKGIFE